MRTKIITLLCAAAALLCGNQPASAQENDGPLATIGDVLIVRPGCVLATAVGSVFFVLSLPWAAPSKSVKKSAQILVITPAKAAFCRPIGDIDDLQMASEDP